MPGVEVRQRRPIKEGLAMKVSETVGNIFIARIYFADMIHLEPLDLAHLVGHFPIMTLMPSHTAPTKPVTMTVMTALNV